MTDPNTVDLHWAVAIAVFSGAIRVGTPYLFVSLGECLTEKAGRVNLGQEGTLVLGAMTAYGVSYLTASECGMWAPWLGVLAAAGIGLVLGALHAVICNRPRVNHVAVGIALFIFGVGLAKYFGKPLIKPSAPQLEPLALGEWCEIDQIRAALKINGLFFIGVVLAPIMAWTLKYTRWGLIVRLAGENEDAAAAMGYSANGIRILTTAIGGALAGIGGSFLSLVYPGAWQENLSTGQGLMAVALVIFAKWDPVRCLWASLLFGGAGALGSALRGAKLSSPEMGYIWDAAPYILTLGIMILTSSRKKAMAGAPGELTRVR
jgi:general nucleoside transport system permease protein